MSKIDQLIDNKLLQNLFIWLCFFLILLGTIQSENRILSAIFIISILAPTIYINNYFILPLFNKNIVQFFFFFILNSIIFTGISFFLFLLSVKREFNVLDFLAFFGIIVLALTFGSAIRISRDSFLRRQQEKNAELKLLKAQLNPHFLFNTLNNLYGLSVTKSDKLPGLMLRLSDLLRYSLYDTKEKYVSLEKELQYLENYISLERIRLDNQTEISLTQSGTFTDKQIAPMLLIVFVENAFKHMGSSTNGKSEVMVNIKIIDNSLNFQCINSIGVNNQYKEKSIEIKKSGIGLENTMKRLSLLYNHNHTLRVEKTKDQYRVELILNLK